MCRWRLRDFLLDGLVLAFSVVLAGCGTTKSRSATEQLLISDAVDRAIAIIDFSPLADKTVFLDTKYLVAVKGIGFVNTEYVTSSLRQQMLASGCLLQEKVEDAEYVVEARIGALGTDSHEVTYGIPPSSGLAHATELVPGAPRVPIPDLSVAKKEDLLGASKVAVFAYHRETKIPVWQSGMSVATSNARDSYVLGMGPIQDGTIYHGTHFAGSRWQIPLLSKKQQNPPTRGLVSYYDEVQFDQLAGRLRRDDGSLGPPPPFALRLHTFQVGTERLSILQDHRADAEAIAQRWEPLAAEFDLREPFGRIREAVDEARRSATRAP